MLLPELSPLPENLNDALESLNRYEKLCKIRPPEHNITSEFLMSCLLGGRYGFNG